MMEGKYILYGKALDIQGIIEDVIKKELDISKEVIYD